MTFLTWISDDPALPTNRTGPIPLYSVKLTAARFLLFCIQVEVPGACPSPRAGLTAVAVTKSLVRSGTPLLCNATLVVQIRCCLSDWPAVSPLEQHWVLQLRSRLWASCSQCRTIRVVKVILKVLESTCTSTTLYGRRHILGLKALVCMVLRLVRRAHLPRCVSPRRPGALLRWCGRQPWQRGLCLLQRCVVLQHGDQDVAAARDGGQAAGGPLLPCCLHAGRRDVRPRR